MGRTIGVVFPAGARIFYLLHRFQTGSEAQPASCPRVPWAFTLGGKAAGE